MAQKIRPRPCSSDMLPQSMASSRAVATTVMDIQHQRPSPASSNSTSQHSIHVKKARLPLYRMDKQCKGDNLLHQSRSLERLVGATFFHGFKTSCRDVDSYFLPEFRDEKSLRLEVYLATTCSRRVELGRADAVGIPAPDLRLLSSYLTDSCHSLGILAPENAKGNAHV